MLFLTRRQRVLDLCDRGGSEDRPELAPGTCYVYWYRNCRCDPGKAANTAKSAALLAKKLRR